MTFCIEIKCDSFMSVLIITVIYKKYIIEFNLI